MKTTTSPSMLLVQFEMIVWLFDPGGSIDPNAHVFEVSSSVFISVVQCRHRFNSVSTDRQCWLWSGSGNVMVSWHSVDVMLYLAIDLCHRQFRQGLVDDMCFVIRLFRIYDRYGWLCKRIQVKVPGQQHSLVIITTSLNFEDVMVIVMQCWWMSHGDHKDIQGLTI